MTGERKNEIVIYQPEDTLRLEVLLDNETVWLTQQQMCELFGRERSVVTKHIMNIFVEGELVEANNVQILHNKHRGKPLSLYSLDVIISVGYRVKSSRGTQFRQWATQVLREYLLRGYAVNVRLNLLEDKVEHRFAEHEQALAELKNKVDFFVQTQTPPLRGIFYDGQIWDARCFVEKLIASARRSILLIDNWATVETLDMLTKKQPDVSVTIVTSEHRGRDGVAHPKLSALDLEKFNAQYPYGKVVFRENCHDRFLILDDSGLYLIGASLKDLGKKCFAFTKLDSSEIPALKRRLLEE